MKKLIFVGILGLFVLGSCNNSTVTHTHNEHDHATEGHNHEAEGSDHSHEGECSGEHNHEAADGHNESAEAHSDEIILPKDTRYKLIQALEMTQNKSQSNPPKKHGNMPL